MVNILSWLLNRRQLNESNERNHVTNEYPSWFYNKAVFFFLSFPALGPTDWYKIAPQCAGTAQSPIDLDCYSLKSNIWEENLAIDFDNEGGLVIGSFTNNGHSPTLAIEKSLGSATLSGGPVGDTVFQLEQFHFHFGCSSFQGSEHTVSGSSYPVEVFLVCCFEIKIEFLTFLCHCPSSIFVIVIIMHFFFFVSS